MTNICFGSSCENVFKFQKTNCSEADRSTSSNFRDNAHRTVERLCFWPQNEHGRKFCEELAPRPGGANDRVHMKPICMSRSKHENFRSCKFIQGKYFLRFLYFALYHSVHRYEHYCRSSPPLRYEFLTGRAACGHFVVINKGGSLHVQSQYLVLK